MTKISVADEFIPFLLFLYRQAKWTMMIHGTKNTSVFERLYNSHTTASVHNKFSKSDDENSTIASVKSLQSAKSNISGPFSRTSLYKPTQAYLHGRSSKFFPKPSLPYKRAVVIPPRTFMPAKTLHKSHTSSDSPNRDHTETAGSRSKSVTPDSKRGSSSPLKSKRRSPRTNDELFPDSPAVQSTVPSMDSTIATDDMDADELLDAILDHSENSDNTVKRLEEAYSQLDNTNKQPLLSGPNHIGDVIEDITIMLPSDEQLAQLFESMNDGKSVSIDQLQEWMAINQPPPLDADILKVAAAGDSLILFENFPDVYKYVTYYQWLAAAFTAIDADGDQVLGKDEFLDLARRLELDVEDVFDEMSDDEGRVKWTDFCQYSVDQQLDFDVIYRNIGVWQDVKTEELAVLNKDVAEFIKEKNGGQISSGVLKMFLASVKKEWDQKDAIEHALESFPDATPDDLGLILLFINYYVQFWRYFSVQSDLGRVMAQDEMIEIMNRWGIPEENYKCLLEEQVILFDKFCLFMAKQRVGIAHSL